MSTPAWRFQPEHGIFGTNSLLLADSECLAQIPPSCGHGPTTRSLMKEMRRQSAAWLDKRGFTKLTDEVEVQL